MKGSKEKVAELSNFSETLLEYVHLSREYERTLHNYGLKEAFGMDVMFTHMEIHVLAAIANNPGIAAHDLAVRFYRTNSAISQMVKFFVKHSLIIKRENPQNARINNLYVTDIGRIAVENHAQHEETLFTNLLPIYEDFSPEEIKKSRLAVQLFIETLKE